MNKKKVFINFLESIQTDDNSKEIKKLIGLVESGYKDSDESLDDIDTLELDDASNELKLSNVNVEDDESKDEAPEHLEDIDSDIDSDIADDKVPEITGDVSNGNVSDDKQTNENRISKFIISGPGSAFIDNLVKTRLARYADNSESAKSIVLQYAICTYVAAIDAYMRKTGETESYIKDNGYDGLIKREGDSYKAIFPSGGKTFERSLIVNLAFNDGKLEDATTFCKKFLGSTMMKQSIVSLLNQFFKSDTTIMKQSQKVDLDAGEDELTGEGSDSVRKTKTVSKDVFANAPGSNSDESSEEHMDRVVAGETDYGVTSGKAWGEGTDKSQIVNAVTTDGVFKKYIDELTKVNGEKLAKKIKSELIDRVSDYVEYDVKDTEGSIFKDEENTIEITTKAGVKKLTLIDVMNRLYAIADKAFNANVGSDSEKLSELNAQIKSEVNDSVDSLTQKTISNDAFRILKDVIEKNPSYIKKTMNIRKDVFDMASKQMSNLYNADTIKFNKSGMEQDRIDSVVGQFKNKFGNALIALVEDVLFSKLLPIDGKEPAILSRGSTSEAGVNDRIIQLSTSVSKSVINKLKRVFESEVSASGKEFILATVRGLLGVKNGGAELMSKIDSANTAVIDQISYLLITTMVNELEKRYNNIKISDEDDEDNSY